MSSNHQNPIISSSWCYATLNRGADRNNSSAFQESVFNEQMRNLLQHGFIEDAEAHFVDPNLEHDDELESAATAPTISPYQTVVHGNGSDLFTLFHLDIARRVIEPNSPYRVGHCIGAGISASVYLCDDFMGGYVAIKIASLADIENEANFLRRTDPYNHPNICKAFSIIVPKREVLVETDEDPEPVPVLGLVLEHLPGGSLHDLIRDMCTFGRKIPLSLAFQFAEDLYRGLDAIHNGPPHYQADDPTTRFKLIDFGFSQNIPNSAFRFRWQDMHGVRLEKVFYNRANTDLCKAAKFCNDLAKYVEDPDREFKLCVLYLRENLWDSAWEALEFIEQWSGNPLPHPEF